MNMVTNQIDEKTYLGGFLLHEAVFKFGDPNLLANYPDPQHIKYPKAVEGDFLKFLGNAAITLHQLQSSKYQRDEIYKKLQTGILAQIKKGDLIPYGFKEPRDIQDMPVKIPADLFFSAELKNKQFEFSGIRILSGFNMAY